MAAVAIYSSTRCDSTACYYSFYTNKLDGRYAEGSWRYSKRGVIESTPEQNRERAVQATLSYLGVNFQNVYGREMTRYDIEGEGDDPAIIAAQDEYNRILYEADAASQKLAAEVAQIELQKQMLSSPTSVWASPDVYAIALSTTEENIVSANSAIAGFQIQQAEIQKSLPGLLNEIQIAGAEKTTTLSNVKNAGIAVLLIPIAIIAIIFILLSGRK